MVEIERMLIIKKIYYKCSGSYVEVEKKLP